jgi:hypothetical protein
MFSTGKAIHTYPHVFAISQDFIHSSQQKDLMGIGYAQSVYGILNLNDTLQPFTTLDYALAPFTAPGLADGQNSTWTVNTTLYSLDLQCEEPENTVANLDLDITALLVAQWRQALLVPK